MITALALAWLPSSLALGLLLGRAMRAADRRDSTQAEWEMAA